MRPAASPEEKLLARAADAFWFGKTFGWTPSQVAAESHILMTRIRIVGHEVDELQERENSRGRPADPDRRGSEVPPWLQSPS